MPILEHVLKTLKSKNIQGAKEHLLNNYGFKIEPFTRIYPLNQRVFSFGNYEPRELYGASEDDHEIHSRFFMQFLEGYMSPGKHPDEAEIMLRTARLFGKNGFSCDSIRPNNMGFQILGEFLYIARPEILMDDDGYSLSPFEKELLLQCRNGRFNLNGKLNLFLFNKKWLRKKYEHRVNECY